MNEAEFYIEDGVLLKYQGDESIVSIPKDVTCIGDSAFKDCVTLRSVIIPDEVTKIGNFAFEGCSNLSRIVIPESISIGWNAFSDCDELTDVIIPTVSVKASILYFIIASSYIKGYSAFDF